MKAYVFCLEPEKKLYEKILRIKNMFLKKVGQCIYLNDPPHITLGVLKLENKFLDDFIKFEDNGLKGFDNKVEIIGKRIFSGDIITGKEAPVYLIKLTPNLKNLQQKLLKFLNTYRNGQVVNRYLGDKFGSELNKNISDYGYPFIGEIWIPHIGIASIDKEKLENSNINWKSEIIEKEYYVSYLVVYLLNEDNDQLTEIKRISLS